MRVGAITETFQSPTPSTVSFEGRVSSRSASWAATNLSFAFSCRVRGMSPPLHLPSLLWDQDLTHLRRFSQWAFVSLPTGSVERQVNHTSCTSISDLSASLSSPTCSLSPAASTGKRRSKEASWMRRNCSPSRKDSKVRPSALSPCSSM